MIHDVPPLLVEKLTNIINSSKLLIRLTVQPFFIYIKPEIIGEGLSPDISLLVNVVKDSLSKHRIILKDSASICDYVIVLKANYRKGGELYGQFTTYVDFSISVISRNDAAGLLELSFSENKGVALDYNAAALKALQKIKTKLDSSTFLRIFDRISGRS